MGTLAEMQNRPQRPAASTNVLPHAVTVSEDSAAGPTETPTPRSRHDFGRLPVHPPAAGAGEAISSLNKPGSVAPAAAAVPSCVNAASLSRGPGGLRIQAKLRVGRSDDPLEREADRVAEAVLGGGPVASPSAAPPAAAQRKCAACETEDEEGLAVRRLSTASSMSEPDGAPAPPLVHETLGAAGHPLDPAARAYFEPRFGHDFGAVRVHTDERAAASVEAVNALAYTVGHHIVFGRGQYAPWAPEGRKLLAHELAHVVQQHQSEPLGAGGRAWSGPAGVANGRVGRKELTLQRAVCPGGKWVQPEEDPLVIQAVEDIDLALKELEGVADDPSVDVTVKREMVRSIKDSVAAVKAYMKVVGVKCVGGKKGVPFAVAGTMDPTAAATSALIAFFAAGLFVEAARRMNPAEKDALDDMAEEMADLAARLKTIEKPKPRIADKPPPEPIQVGPREVEPIPPLELPTDDTRRRRKRCSNMPSPSPLPIRWPLILPYPDDLNGLVRTPGEDMAERGEAQRKMQKQIDEARSGKNLKPPPSPCDPDVELDESRWNAPYDAHHKHPLYLGGSDEPENLCALSADLHQKGHPLLDNQTEFLDEYVREGICSGYLSKHPRLQTYFIVGDK